MIPSPSEPPEPYDFLASFLDACARHHEHGPKTFDWYFTHGYVFKGPDHLMLAGPDDLREDAWHVFWAETHPKRPFGETVAMLLDYMPYERPYVSWARGLLGRNERRYYLTARLRSLTQKAPP